MASRVVFLQDDFSFVIQKVKRGEVAPVEHAAAGGAVGRVAEIELVGLIGFARLLWHVGVDAEHGHGFVLQLIDQLVHQGDDAMAGMAPAAPEDGHHLFAAEVTQLEAGALDVFPIDLRHSLPTDRLARACLKTGVEL